MGACPNRKTVICRYVCNVEQPRKDNPQGRISLLVVKVGYGIRKFYCPHQEQPQR